MVGAAAISGKPNRLVGIDLVKVVAIIFVLVLHVNGYALLLLSDQFGSFVRLAYYVIEAIAIPAIHMFVLAGCWLMLLRGVSLRSYLRIWLLTLSISVTGLVISCLIDPRIVRGEIIGCIFPILFKSYWFVTCYVALMLIAPFLVKLVQVLDDNKLGGCTIAMCIVAMALPMIPASLKGFLGDRFTLFVALFFVAAYIQRKNWLHKYRMRFVIGSLVCVVLLVASAYALRYLGGPDKYFYDYSSILVVGHGVCLFCLLAGSKPPRLIELVVEKTVGMTLAVYLLHLHPILKQHYTEWGSRPYSGVKDGK